MQFCGYLESSWLPVSVELIVVRDKVKYSPKKVITIAECVLVDVNKRCEVTMVVTGRLTQWQSEKVWDHWPRKAVS